MTTEPNTQNSLLDNPYHVELDVFEGPLDLLLHLIKENDVDIFNIPIANITKQYVQYIETMQSLNLTIAGEFLLMASTLAHIKSKMLLPPDPTEEDTDEEGQDPREELVKRLLTYQKYKQAATMLDDQPHLGRDVFVREAKRPKKDPDAPVELADVSIFKLVESFHRILDQLQLNQAHDVEMENFSIADSAQHIQALFVRNPKGRVRFMELFEQTSKPSYGQVVAYFLAVLSMIKRGVLKVLQSQDFDDIYLESTPQINEGAYRYDGREFDEPTVDNESA